MAVKTTDAAPDKEPAPKIDEKPKAQDKPAEPEQAKEAPADEPKASDSGLVVAKKAFAYNDGGVTRNIRKGALGPAGHEIATRFPDKFEPLNLDFGVEVLAGGRRRRGRRRS